jgi:hypothetical protein
LKNNRAALQANGISVYTSGTTQTWSFLSLRTDCLKHHPSFMQIAAVADEVTEAQYLSEKLQNAVNTETKAAAMKTLVGAFKDCNIDAVDVSLFSALEKPLDDAAALRLVESATTYYEVSRAEMTLKNGLMVEAYRGALSKASYTIDLAVLTKALAEVLQLGLRDEVTYVNLVAQKDKRQDKQELEESMIGKCDLQALSRHIATWMCVGISIKHPNVMTKAAKADELEQQQQVMIVLSSSVCGRNIWAMEEALKKNNSMPPFDEHEFTSATAIKLKPVANDAAERTLAQAMSTQVRGSQVCVFLFVPSFFVICTLNLRNHSFAMSCTHRILQKINVFLLFPHHHCLFVTESARVNTCDILKNFPTFWSVPQC